MKILALCCIVMMLSTIASVANCKNIINLSKNLHLIEDSFTLGGIFFKDDENNIMFIDFEVIEDVLHRLSVLKAGEKVLDDDLKEIPSDSIYELDLNQFGQGLFTIEIMTENDVKIQKDILIE